MASILLDQAVERMRMEYAEMPDLALTFWQAQRLWNLPADVCGQALSVLVTADFLTKTRHGAWVRKTEERSARRILPSLS